MSVIVADHVLLTPASAGASPGASHGDLVTLVRDAVATGQDSVVIVIAPDLDMMAKALVRAAIGPLAVDYAPAVRINAVAPSERTAADVIDRAVAFLESARSTTGQILDLG